MDIDFQILTNGFTERYFAHIQQTLTSMKNGVLCVHNIEYINKVGNVVLHVEHHRLPAGMGWKCDAACEKTQYEKKIVPISDAALGLPIIHESHRMHYVAAEHFNTCTLCQLCDDHDMDLLEYACHDRKLTEHDKKMLRKDLQKDK